MTRMMSIDEALSTIIGATYTRWIEHRTESGNWSRRRHQETRAPSAPCKCSISLTTRYREKSAATSATHLSPRES